jgi:molybdopterin synthase catalytic subunit
MAMTLCRITRTPIDAGELLEAVPTERDGAALLFWGVVRNHNEGRAVSHLEYEAYPEMAEAVLSEIAAEARARWPIGGLAIVHRLGRLSIGEVSVGIAVAAPHRAAAYEASRYIIEELKQRVPIWKREGYAEGDEHWLGGEQRGTGPAAAAPSRKGPE